MVAGSPSSTVASGAVRASARTLTTNLMVARRCRGGRRDDDGAREQGQLRQRSRRSRDGGWCFSGAEVPVEFVGVVAAEFSAVVGDPVGEHDLASRGGIGIGEAVGHRLVFLASEQRVT